MRNPGREPGVPLSWPHGQDPRSTAAGRHTRSASPHLVGHHRLARGLEPPAYRHPGVRDERRSGGEGAVRVTAWPDPWAPHLPGPPLPKGEEGDQHAITSRQCRSSSEISSVGEAAVGRTVWTESQAGVGLAIRRRRWWARPVTVDRIGRRRAIVVLEVDAGELGAIPAGIGHRAARVGALGDRSIALDLSAKNFADCTAKARRRSSPGAHVLSGYAARLRRNAPGIEDRRGGRSVGGNRNCEDGRLQILALGEEAFRAHHAGNESEDR
jgi:hypothetical protein